MTEYTGLSESDNSNTTVSSVNIAEGCPPSGINDALRAILGLLARALNMLTGKYASTGSANAYVLTPSSALPAYTTGGRYSFRANFANTGAATLNISSLGAKTIKKMTASGKADLASGDIQSGQPVTVEYDGTDLVMVTPVAEFNPANILKQTPSFSAHKNGTSQTGVAVSTDTKVTFGTEDWDTHGFFDATNSRFLPTIAGKYRISANVYFTSTNAQDGNAHGAAIYKNGSAHKYGPQQISGAVTNTSVGVSAIVDFNGSTDYVEIYAFAGGSGNRTIDGTATLTYFQAEML